MDDFFKYLDIPFTFKEKVSGEHIGGDLRKSFADFPVLAHEDVIVDLEFESQDINLDVILKCLRYSTQLLEDFRKPVYIFIVSLKEEKNHIIRFKPNLFDRFYIFTISLTSKDQMKTLNTLKLKIKSKEKLFGTDIVALKLLPIIDIDHKKEVLVECIDLLNKIENLPTEKFNEILNIYLLN